MCVAWVLSVSVEASTLTHIKVDVVGEYGESFIHHLDQFLHSFIEELLCDKGGGGGGVVHYLYILSDGFAGRSLYKAYVGFLDSMLSMLLPCGVGTPPYAQRYM